MIRDLLQRFRPAGPPGPVGSVAVPADQDTSATAELRAVFALLAEVTAEANELRVEATKAAKARQDEARGRAARLLADARRQADVVRAEAFAAARANVEAEGAAVLATAEADAARIRDHAERQLPTYIQRAVDTALADLGADPTTSEYSPESASPRETANPADVVVT